MVARLGPVWFGRLSSSRFCVCVWVWWGPLKKKPERRETEMAPTFDCTGTSLLCAEDNNSLMGFDDLDCGSIHDDNNEEDEFEGVGCYNLSQNRSFCDFFLMGFPMQDDKSLGLMVERESDHLPRQDYHKRLQSGELDMDIRRAAIDWIRKVHGYYCFGPLSAYLSINYLDRFLSVCELPRGKAWMMQLLAVTCLSLGAKMEEIEVPLILDLQVGDTKYVFEAKTIQRMELLVLSTLNYRMQAVTPFSYLDYFLYKMNNEQTLPNSSISRSVELILNIVKGIDYLKFRPSEVAAAVAITVLGEKQTVDIDMIGHVEKGRVLKCVEMIQEMCVKGAGNRVSIPSVPHSPIGVLDAACLSYKSDELTVESCGNSSRSTPEANKRRKLG